MTTASDADSQPDVLSTVGPYPGQLITPDDYPTWVPGTQYLKEAENIDHSGVTVRGFRYSDLDVTLPPVRDYLVVAYDRGTADMRRQFDGRWSRETLEPGDVTLLTRAVETRWTWRETIDVIHVHLTHDLVQSVCQQMYERDIDDVQVRDELKADDDVIYQLAVNIASEAALANPGGSLLVDSLSTLMAVHLLRNHAEFKFREYRPPHGMSTKLLSTIRDYVGENMHEPISLAELAGTVGMSKYHFSRRFKDSTGMTPHSYVTAARLTRAKRILARYKTIPLVEVATACGFSDQSHMNRVFKKYLGTTPGKFRQSNS